MWTERLGVKLFLMVASGNRLLTTQTLEIYMLDQVMFMILKKDVFIQTQPYASWTLDANNKWQPPIAEPPDFVADDYRIAAQWDEDNQRWIIEDREVNPDEDSFVLRIWDPATSSWTT